MPEEGHDKDGAFVGVDAETAARAEEEFGPESGSRVTSKRLPIAPQAADDAQTSDAKTSVSPNEIGAAEQSHRAGRRAKVDASGEINTSRRVTSPVAREEPDTGGWGEAPKVSVATSKMGLGGTTDDEDSGVHIRTTSEAMETAVDHPVVPEEDENGSVYIRTTSEAMETAADHPVVPEEDENRSVHLRTTSEAMEIAADDLVVPEEDEDDFEIAVDVQDFHAGARTKPVERSQLINLLHACSEPTSDGVESIGQPPAGPRNQAGPDPAVPPGGETTATNAWQPALGNRLPTTIAVDFGTSYSSIAVVLSERTHVLPLTSSGLRMLPSVVGIDSNGHAVVGEQARQMALDDPGNVISSPKRLLGRTYDDPEVEPHIAQMAMAASHGPFGSILLHAQGRTYTVEQLCAPILHWLRRAAGDQLGRDITDIVATVPVGFDDTHRRALSESATMAGLRIRSYLDEPTAAVLANRRTLQAGGLVAVYDFGGGTFDFSVVEVGENARLSVVTNAGDTWLGGDDFDEVIASAAANQFWRDTRIELRNDVVRWQRLLRESERAKRELSRKREATVHLPGAALTAKGPVDLTIQLTREQFAELSKDLIQRTMDTCETALDLCDLKFSDLNAIYMSGGTSYVPAVMESIAQVFGIIPMIVAPPDLAVVLGAARFTELLEQKTAQPRVP
jgi:actin-like ATPase involved in cell morphogenesis